MTNYFRKALCVTVLALLLATSALADGAMSTDKAGAPPASPTSALTAITVSLLPSALGLF